MALHMGERMVEQDIESPRENAPQAIAETAQIQEAEILLSAGETRMLEAFYAFSSKELGVDPREAHSDDAPQLAIGVHRFAAAAAERRYAYIQEQKSLRTAALERAKATDVYLAIPEAPPDIILLPREPIESRIRKYYEEFGTNRRTKTLQVLIDREQEFLKRKRPVFANLYSSDRTEKIPRAQQFPELGIEIQLEELLRLQGYETAADSVETVLAAHGDRFATLALNAGRRAMGHTIQTVNVEGLPTEMQAEKYRPRR